LKILRRTLANVGLEAGLAPLAGVVADWRKDDLSDRPGAGAAGGLGFGLMAFCGAEVHRGFDEVAELLRLAEAIAEADLIITGEGSLDAQTLEGKAPAGVAELARRFGKSCIAFAGRVDPASLPLLLEHFDEITALADSSITVLPRSSILTQDARRIKDLTRPGQASANSSAICPPIE
jgi:glycerate 2-kinase